MIVVNMPVDVRVTDGGYVAEWVYDPTVCYQDPNRNVAIDSCRVLVSQRLWDIQSGRQTAIKSSGEELKSIDPSSDRVRVRVLTHHPEAWSDFVDSESFRSDVLNIEKRYRMFFNSAVGPSDWETLRNSYLEDVSRLLGLALVYYGDKKSIENSSAISSSSQDSLTSQSATHPTRDER